jgi:hypothetical protein
VLPYPNVLCRVRRVKNYMGRYLGFVVEVVSGRGWNVMMMLRGARV